MVYYFFWNKGENMFSLTTNRNEYDYESDVSKYVWEYFIREVILFSMLATTMSVIECTTLNTFCQLLKDPEMMNYLYDSLIVVTARIGEKRSIVDLFFMIVVVFCIFCI